MLVVAQDRREDDGRIDPVVPRATRLELIAPG
jgi:hypothetical protein